MRWMIALLILAGMVAGDSHAAPTVAPGNRPGPTTQMGEQIASADADQVAELLRQQRPHIETLKQLHAEHGQAGREADQRFQPQAMWLLALCDVFGVVETADGQLTGKRLRHAADSGYAPALMTIGNILRYSDKRYDQAMRYYLSAVAAKESSANYMVGTMHLFGEGVAINKSEAASWFTKGAEQGHAASMWTLGLMLINGDGIERDEKTGGEWLHKSAQTSHPHGMMMHGVNLLSGGSAGNSQREPVGGASWLRKAADAGDYDAMYYLAVCYGKGDGLPQSDTLAESWLKKAADAGHERAREVLKRLAPQIATEASPFVTSAAVLTLQREAPQQAWRGPTEQLAAAAPPVDPVAATLALAYRYRNGQDVPKDLVEAARWFERAAQSGHPIALYELGAMYEQGLGVEKDATRALPLFRRAADQGHVPARIKLIRLGGRSAVTADEEQQWLMQAADANEPYAAMIVGQRYILGQTITQDVPRGVKMLHDAASAGEPHACFLVGQMHEQGQSGMTADLPAAIEWYLRGAAAGSAICMNEMGRLCQNGTGVPQDAALAVEWYGRSARGGCAMGMANLGCMYANGSGVERDFTRACEQFLAAANANEPMGMLQLGVMYLNGMGVPKDAGKGTELIRMAAQRGNSQAQQILRANGLNW